MLIECSSWRRGQNSCQSRVSGKTYEVLHRPGVALELLQRADVFVVVLPLELVTEGEAPVRMEPGRIALVTVEDAGVHELLHQRLRCVIEGERERWDEPSVIYIGWRSPTAA